MAQEFEFDCIIIGGGPAGLTAAIYLQRYHRRTLVIDEGDPRIRYAPRIRNLIGYAKGISGRTLLRRLYRQACEFKVQMQKGRASVFRKRGGFEVRITGQAKALSTPYVILATGIRDIQPPHTDFSDLCKLRVLAYCPICDGFDHSDRKVGVIINSRKGFKKLRFLYSFSRNLHAIVTKPIAISKKYQTQLLRAGITIHEGEIEKLKYGDKRKNLIVKLRGQRQFEVDMAYVELGFKVQNTATRHLHGLRKCQDGRYLMSRHQETSIRGLYAIGDCANSLAQVSVAVGEASIAATHVHNQLNRRARSY